MRLERERKIVYLGIFKVEQKLTELWKAMREHRKKAPYTRLRPYSHVIRGKGSILKFQ